MCDEASLAVFTALSGAWPGHTTVKRAQAASTLGQAVGLWVGCVWGAATKTSFSFLDPPTTPLSPEPWMGLVIWTPAVRSPAPLPLIFADLQDAAPAPAVRSVFPGKSVVHTAPSCNHPGSLWHREKDLMSGVAAFSLGAN